MGAGNQGAYGFPAGSTGSAAPQTFPAHATLFHDESLKAVGNAFSVQHDANQNYAVYNIQSPAADADEFSQAFFLDVGTYSFSALGVNHTTGGKIDWYIDGTAFSTGQDWYAGAVAYNITKAITGVVISSGGKHTLKGKVNGKNAASSGYLIPLTKMWFG